MSTEATYNTSIAGASFSTDRAHRYILWRKWKEDGRNALCIGLNPSNASEQKNDPTIIYLMKILKLNDYTGLFMGNLFTNITSKPNELPDYPSESDLQVLREYSRNKDVIFCWGGFKKAKERQQEVIDQFPNALCFGHNNDGSPIHPAFFVRCGFNPKLISIMNFK